MFKKIAKFILIILLYLGFVPFSGKAYLPKVRELAAPEIRCTSEEVLYSYPNENVICVTGVISEKTAKAIKNYEPKISRLIIDSEGGDADSGMLIGRRIFRDRAIVEVKNKCISSCANYIVPSAAKVIVNESSFIVMHGAIPRGVSEYYQRFYANDSTNLKDKLKAREDFRKVRNGILAREAEYFDDLFVDDAYVTRYREKIRDIIHISNRRCKKYKEFFLILDREYLESFGITVDKWPEKNERELFSLATKNFPHANIVFGLHPRLVRLLPSIGTQCVRLGPTKDDDDPVIF